MSQFEELPRLDYSLRTTPEGMPGFVTEQLADGSTRRTAIVSRSLREVFPSTVEVSELTNESSEA